MDDKEEYIDMKTYVTMDIEGTVKELDFSEWSSIDTDEDYSYRDGVKSKPFAYIKMLQGVMEHLERTGGVEFVILKDPELGRWWTGKVKERERQRKFTEAREKLHSTLSKEELKILGIKI